LIYPILEEEEEEEQEQKKALNNYHHQQQQLHSQAIISSTITATTYQNQVSSNISRTNNLVSQKMTPWKSSLLLSMQTNHHNTLWW
jgi:hypothetical protein